MTSSVVLLCTGNAARSVMAGRFIEETGLPLRVVTAGTHVVENQPMSRSTRAALVAAGAEPGMHRSHQLTDADADDATLIVAMAAEHVRYVRQHFPQAASRTATIRYLAEHLKDGSLPLSERIARLSLDQVPLEDQADVDDPAGAAEPVYIECAFAISGLVQQMVPSLES